MSRSRQQHTPTHVVQELFTALGSPDRGEVLALLTDDVEWWVAGPAEIPYAGTFRGRDEVARFFSAFDGAIDYESWEARQFIAEGYRGGHRRRALAREDERRVVDNPWVLVLTVRDGKIARFRAYEDTAASRDAFLPAMRSAQRRRQGNVWRQTNDRHWGRGRGMMGPAFTVQLHDFKMLVVDARGSC